jgi:hypothetical protein
LYSNIETLKMIYYAHFHLWDSTLG